MSRIYIKIMTVPNQSLFGNMKIYSPLKADDDDIEMFGDKVGDLLDMSSN